MYYHHIKIYSFCTVIESVGIGYRANASLLAEMGWCLGYMLMALAAYLIPHFRNLQLVVSCGEIIWIIWSFKIKESPRWQLTKGKYEKAEKTMVKAAKKKGTLMHNKMIIIIFK